MLLNLQWDNLKHFASYTLYLHTNYSFEKKSFFNVVDIVTHSHNSDFLLLSLAYHHIFTGEHHSVSLQSIFAFPLDNVYIPKSLNKISFFNTKYVTFTLRWLDQIIIFELSKLFVYLVWLKSPTMPFLYLCISSS